MGNIESINVSDGFNICSLASNLRLSKHAGANTLVLSQNKLSTLYSDAKGFVMKSDSQKRRMDFCQRPKKLKGVNPGSRLNCELCQNK